MQWFVFPPTHTWGMPQKAFSNSPFYCCSEPSKYFSSWLWLKGKWKAVKFMENVFNCLKYINQKKEDFRGILWVMKVSLSLTLQCQWEVTNLTDLSSSKSPTIQSPALPSQILTLVKARVNTCSSHFDTASLCRPQIRAFTPGRKQIPAHWTNFC